jgi:hypothetical protein
MERRRALKLGLSGLAAGALAWDGWARAVDGVRAVGLVASENALPFDRMAAHIVRALRPERGERTILRHDPKLLPALLAETKRQLEVAGCAVQSLAYGPAEGFGEKLAQTDIYVWLPAGPGAITPADEAAALVRWLDAGGGRQIHFHWGDGTRDVDGTNRPHTAAYDQVYLDALDIDYGALDRAMDAAIAKLRSGEVRVMTPAGTDIRFRVGGRPFCKQNGDASRERMKAARVRIDREIELPAGAMRVAPLEESVSGRIVIPHARLSGTHVNRIVLALEKGKLSDARASAGEAKLKGFLESNDALACFREFALGINPKLLTPPGEKWVAYYGYGAGVVRLSLGNNEELGGAVRGRGVWWFFFPDATVTVAGATVVEEGKLAETS